MKWNKIDMIGRWISFLYRYNQIFMDEQLKKFNIGSGQFIFFIILLTHDGMSQESLANILNIDKGTTAVAMKKLESEGYIVRKKDKKDKRSYRIFVTEKALGIQDEFKNILSEWTELLTKGFTSEEKQTASDLLMRMNNNACEALKAKKEHEK